MKPLVRLNGTQDPPEPKLLWHPISRGDKAAGEMLMCSELFLVCVLFYNSDRSCWHCDICCCKSDWDNPPPPSPLSCPRPPLSLRPLCVRLGRGDIMINHRYFLSRSLRTSLLGVDCSQPSLYFNAKISKVGNSERRARVRERWGRRGRKKERPPIVLAPRPLPLVSLFCAHVQSSCDPLCAGCEQSGLGTTLHTLRILGYSLHYSYDRLSLEQPHSAGRGCSCAPASVLPWKSFSCGRSSATSHAEESGRGESLGLRFLW